MMANDEYKSRLIGEIRVQTYERRSGKRAYGPPSGILSADGVQFNS